MIDAHSVLGEDLRVQKARVLRDGGPLNRPCSLWIECDRLHADQLAVGIEFDRNGALLPAVVGYLGERDQFA